MSPVEKFPPFTVGDTVTLRGMGTVTVTAPDGQIIEVEAGVERTVRFQVWGPGEYTYTWDSDELGPRPLTVVGADRTGRVRGRTARSA